jgi:hypothetical protein
MWRAFDAFPAHLPLREKRRVVGADGGCGENRPVEVVEQQCPAAGLDFEYAAGRNLGAARYLDPRHVVACQTRILPIP